jgi:hypothetical protein
MPLPAARISILLLTALVLLQPMRASAETRASAAETDKHIAVIWNACEARFGPAPDPERGQTWTTAEKQRAINVIHCLSRLLSAKAATL